MAESAQTSSEDPVAEWHYLSDRAQQIYGGLVGLSDFGHWDSYFSRTFDIYTRVCCSDVNAQSRFIWDISNLEFVCPSTQLWRFQQQHRYAFPMLSNLFYDFAWLYLCHKMIGGRKRSFF